MNLETQKEVLCPDCGSLNKPDNELCTKCNSLLKLNDKYFLIKILGENIGVTYLAKDLSDDYFVIKELTLRSVEKWKDTELFKREGEILSQLNHKSIPKFIEEFETGIGRNTHSYIVMENIDGLSLRSEFKNKRYTEEEALDVVLQIAEILDYLHKLRPPIVHRDIKLSNIMRRKNGDFVIIDFGSVKNIVNNNATVSGTFGFMAPEQFTGKATQASDFYSLGVILLVLLTRKEPEDMLENSLELNWKEHIYASDKVIFLIEGLLEKNPQKRIKSLGVLKNILKDEKTYNKAVVSEKTDNLLVSNKYKAEFKKIDNEFLGLSEESNYKHWKGNLDTILGFGLIGSFIGTWYYYTWYIGLGAGLGFLIFFMFLTSSWYHSKAKKFLNILIEKMGNTDDTELTIAMLNVWAIRHDLGDEFLDELKKYQIKQIRLNNISVQNITDYKLKINENDDFEKFISAYMLEIHPED